MNGLSRYRFAARVLLEMLALLLLAAGAYHGGLQAALTERSREQQVWGELLLFTAPGIGLLVWRGIRRANSSMGARVGARLNTLLRRCVELLAMGLLVSGLLVQHQIESELEVAQARFNHLEHLQTQEVLRRFETSASGLRALSAHYAASDSLKPAEFSRFVAARDLALEFPGVRGFGLIERVNRSDLPGFVAATRASGAASFSVQSTGTAADLYLLRYLEPPGANQATPGWDVGADAVLREAAERATSTGQLSLSGHRPGHKEDSQGDSYAFLLPLHRAGAALDSEAARRSATVGLLYSPFVLSELMAGIDDLTRGMLDFDLIDGSHTPVFALDDTDSRPGSAANAASGRGRLFRAEHSLSIGGRQLSMQLSSTPSFERSVLNGQPFSTGVTGICLSLMITFVLWLSGIGRARALAIADEMTQDLHLAKAELASKNERLQLALEGSSDGLWDRLDTRADAAWWSPQYYRLLGHAPGDITASVQAFEQLLHPQDLGRTQAAVAQALRGDSRYDVEFRLLTQSGEYRWFRSRAKVFRGAGTDAVRMAGSLQDIHALKRIQAERLEHGQQLTAIFALSPDGFVSFDATHAVRFASPAFTRLTGLPMDSVQGLNLRALLTRLAAHKRPASPLDPALLERLRAGPLRLEIDRPARRMLELTLHQGFDHSGGEVSQLLHLRDITHQVEVDQMKSEFLSTAAHELRTPMTSIHGLTELLLTRTLSAERQKQFLTQIYSQSTVMMDTLSELLDLARIEARRGKDFEPMVLALRPLIEQALLDFEPPAGRDRPVMCSPDDVDLHALIDGQKFRQVLHHLLSNAYKYSPAGGPVALSLNLQQSREAGLPLICIEVQDHGIGMSPAELPRVTERFYRADKSGLVSGTGLGMSIVKEIVELMDGQLRLRSKPGLGTTVTVLLPPATAAPDNGARPAAQVMES